MIDQPLPGAGATKAEWRLWAGRQWGRIDLIGVSRAVLDGLLAWQPLSGSGTVLLYLPMGDELDLRELADAGLPGTLAVTRTPAEGPLTVHPFHGPLEEHRFGFLQPLAGAPQVDPADIAVALVPGRCFDEEGTRIGRGVGYYDELLARLPESAYRVGIAPRALVVRRLPSTHRDVAMSHLATEDGVRRVGEM